MSSRRRWASTPSTRCKTDLRLRLDQQKEVAYIQAKEKTAREELASALQGDIPESMIQGRMRSLFTDFDRRLQEQGTTLEAVQQRHRPDQRDARG